MNTAKLSEYLDKLEKTSSRNEITEMLAKLFGELTADEIDKVVYMLLGRLAPAYENVVFNVADNMMMRAIAEAYAVPIDEVKSEYKKLGDLGAVAQKYAKHSGHISVAELYDTLHRIADYGGEGSQEEKIDSLAKLLVSLDANSVRYVARIPVGKLRLGFSDKTIIDALSVMEAGDKSKSKVIESAYQALPDVGKIAVRVKKDGTGKLSQEITPEVGVPIMPMLAQRLKSPVEMIKKMGEVALEPKFDGLRAQIHFDRKKKLIRVFTRNLNDVSEMFPEVQKIGDYVKADSIILDSEAVGLDPNTKKMADFQTTMNRRRKHDITESARKTPLRFQVFDVMLVDGKSFMGKDYEARRTELKKIIKENSTFVVDEYEVTSEPEKIREEHEAKIKKGLEGIMIKKAKSDYVPGRTGWRWVKMKEEETKEGKLADTVDAVIMGYTRGRGKRASFGVGQFLAGVKSGDKFLTITKVGTGLSDDQFKELNKRLGKIESKGKPKEYEVHKDLEPDFWVLPKLVVEIAADEITKSPKHTAELALRFPRLIKFRDDKSPSEATTLTELKHLYKLQKKG